MDTEKKTLKSKTLKPLKQKIGLILKRGYTNIRFSPKALEYIIDRGSVIKNSLARQLVDKKLCRILPKKKRTYKIYPVKKAKLRSFLEKTSKVGTQVDKVIASLKNKKVVYKPMSSLNYLKKRKICTDKDIWAKKIRAYRAILQQNKTILKQKGEYKKYRLKVKGNFFKNENALKESIRSLEQRS